MLIERNYILKMRNRARRPNEAKRHNSNTHTHMRRQHTIHCTHQASSQRMNEDENRELKIGNETRILIHFHITRVHHER